jgi:4-amino-4-deoxy-L-arabinose transferase-like glycosyltransferase
MSTSSVRTTAARTLLLAGVLGLLGVVHAPNHLASALGRLLWQPTWIDPLHLMLPPGLKASFWIPAALLAAGLALRQTHIEPEEGRPALGRRDLSLGLMIAAGACLIRLWPILREPRIKPDYDEGVYLGGAWLLRDGVLPYRDFVFPHLPGALILLQPSAWLIQRWHDNSAALAAARMTAALSDGLATGLVYLAARQLTATPGALLAALVYASDTLAIEYSRGVRLEPLQAPWLVASAALLLATLNGRRLGVAAGLCAALGVCIKITGVVFPVAGLIALLLARRWRPARDFALGLALGGIALCGWCVLTSGDAIVRQTVLLQIQRPPEPYRERWEWLLGDQWTGFTAIMGLLGGGALAARAWRKPISAGWLFVSLWLALTFLLLALASSFYDHYYTTLVAPLALLAAATPGLPGLRELRWGDVRARSRLVAAGLGGLLLLPLWWGQARLWGNVDRAPTMIPDVQALLALPPDRPVLTFDPLLSVLAGRPIMQAPGGPYLLDWFLSDPYLSSALNHGWPDAPTARAAAGAAAEYILGNRFDTSPIPTLLSSFIWQPVATTDGTLLFTRVDQRDAVLQAGPDLQLLRRTDGRIEATAGQRQLVQPLHWRSEHTPAPEQALALALVDASGATVAKIDVPLNGGIAWTAGQITTLEYRIPLPADLPAGTYRLTATVYSWADGQRVQLAPLAGGAGSDTLELPPIQLGAP